MIIMMESDDIAAHKVSLSFAATVRKLLRLHVLAEKHEQVLERLKLWVEQPSLEIVWRKQRAETMRLVTAIIPALVTLSGEAIDMLVARGFDGMGKSSPVSSSEDMGNSSGSEIAVSHGEDQQATATDDGARFGFMVMLVAMNDITCDQLFCWVMNGVGNGPERGTTASSVEAPLHPEQFAKLTDWAKGWTVRVPSALLPDTASERESEAIMYSSGMRVRLHQVTPGCCNLSCTTLDGLSESTLKTQLCGGCKMARYCCVQCQKRAWLDGGHSIVCEKWRLSSMVAM